MAIKILKKCPKCGNNMVLELKISEDKSENNFICEKCGFYKRYDPFNDDIRKINTEQCEIKLNIEICKDRNKDCETCQCIVMGTCEGHRRKKC